jgi:2,4-dienoyl-CoA reductase (NADPH2)
VTVLEREHRPGGQLFLAGLPETRRGFWDLAEDLARRAEAAGAEIRYDLAATPERVRALAPAVVLVASGAGPAGLPVPGADLPHVHSAWDVLRGRVDVGDRVVVIGGGATGCEVALHLAQRGVLDAETVRFLLVSGAEAPEEIVRLATVGTRKVTLVEMSSKVGAEIGRSTRWVVLQDLKRYGVEVRTGATVQAITAEGVEVVEHGEAQVIPCDQVVHATGVRPESAIADALEAAGLPVQRLGDAKQPRKALDAVHEGFDTGWAL